MEAVCSRDDTRCEVRALAVALQTLHLYCTIIATVFICCCAKPPSYRHENQWRGQNFRGMVSLTLGVVWCFGAASAALRPADTLRLVSAVLAPPAWLAATVLHIALWTRRSAAPLLYLAIYWLLAAASSATVLWQHVLVEVSLYQMEIYIQSLSTLLALLLSCVDCVCFYDEVAKRFRSHQTSFGKTLNKITYKHNLSYFYSKISFLWLNSFLYRGYMSPLEEEDLGELPEGDRSHKYYLKFKKIYENKKNLESDTRRAGIWQCYIAMVWPKFYIAGILKLFGDMIGVVPPLGLAVVIQFIDGPVQTYDGNSEVTIKEFFANGYVMLFIITLALLSQAFLSQNSTHLVTVEGIRLKTALQGMVYDKCMRLAPWSTPDMDVDEESPLLHANDETISSKSGLLTNLVSQDTYNIMSCVWVCHYIWAIPLKIMVILYLLYTKLGVSAIIGSTASVLFITPLQFYIGKKIFDNSKDISKCTDHRISKIAEILQGINVIKLYVWEDLFNEKILNLREVELKLLNKESMYWSFLSFTTQVSTILVTVITFTAYYFLGNSKDLTAVNVFAGLALFNQLFMPLLILPVTVYMVIQAMVSTKRIKEFLELPESNNVKEQDDDYYRCLRKEMNKFNGIFDDTKPADDSILENPMRDPNDVEDGDQFFDDADRNQKDFEQQYLVQFRNAAFSWGMKGDTLLEIDDLDIPAGKLIMVVGTTGAGKTSLLSAILKEMYLERGDVYWNGHYRMWYAGQPPWLLEGSVRDNIVMDNSWCQKRYSRVIRATGLQPDLQLLPEGDATRLGSHGTPLSGGQRVRVCLARALYSDAQLLVLDEPLAALDAPLARHVVTRALIPAARIGRTVLLATNRLELLHYADLVIAVDDGRVSGCGHAVEGDAALRQWAQLAAEARAVAARAGAGPLGGTARERTRLVRALSRARFQRFSIEDTTQVGISEATGAHLLTEVPTCAGGSWRRTTWRQRPALFRQLSSPPPSIHNSKCRRDIRRAVSADASDAALRREASLLRRLLRPKRHRTLTRWTPKPLRRLISTDSESPVEDNNSEGNESKHDIRRTSVTSNGVDVPTVIISKSTPIETTDNRENTEILSERPIWLEYARACGWWGVAYWMAAAAAQGLALAADFWLTYTTAENSRIQLTDQQMWSNVRLYAVWCACGAAAAGGAQAASACAGAAARRALHERLLHAALHAPLHHHQATPPGAALHRFSADILVIDKKLPTAVSRWAQLLLLCGATTLVNAVAAPWTLLALLPAFLFYLALQSVYLANARELQRTESRSAAAVVSLAAETSAGGGTVRAGALQSRMRAAFMRRLDRNHNALLLLNAANRWLGLTLDLVGAASVCASIGVALHGGVGSAMSGLAGAYALLLPAYLAHLAKCRADLDLQLAAVERVCTDTNVPQEDYRDDCPIPSGWKRNGKIEFENLTIEPEPGAPPILNNINISVAAGEKIAICGRSGSGKSTLLLSCAGAAAVSSGRVVVDGIDATQLPIRALRHSVVILPQEAILFSGTLRENLDPLAVHTDDEIWQSLNAVGLHDFVTAQPAGLECLVGRARCGWSVGRAARACAARAALRARLAGALLLDEPGAALDAAAEQALLAALAAAAPDTTIITVAHRVSSVRGYSRAVVLDAGRVVEQGAVSALLAQPSSRLARMLAAASQTHSHI